MIHNTPFGSSYSSLKKPATLFKKIDLALALPLLGIIIYGLFILYSASSQDLYLVLKQGIRILLGWGIIIVIIQTPQIFWQKIAFLAYCTGLGLLIAVLLFGTDAKGAQRWITIPGIMRFQPSEIMKLAIPLMLASLFAHNALPPKKKTLLLGVLAIIVPTVLIAKQPDLGTSLLIAYSGFMALMLAGFPWRYLAILTALSIPSTWVLWQYFMHAYQKQRVLTLLNPDADPLGYGWNIIQSKAAIGSGGIDGKGWLNGTQSQLDFLPESSTDFIIAVVGEEMGFKGIMLLFIFYFIICARGLLIAWNAKDTFGRLLAGTLTFTFFIYVFVNVGMVTGLLPVVGVPLPLVSYGGSSVVSLMASLGFLFAIQANTVHGQK